MDPTAAASSTYHTPKAATSSLVLSLPEGKARTSRNIVTNAGDCMVTAMEYRAGEVDATRANGHVMNPNTTRSGPIRLVGRRSHQNSPIAIGAVLWKVR
jgi:hypothetical protein